MSFKPRTVKVPLFGGDYQQRVDLLDADLEAARTAAERAKKSTAPRTLSDDAPGAPEEARVVELEAEREALVAEAEENGEVTIVTLQALSKKDGKSGRRRWNDLVSEHPPRDDNDVDAELGVNDSTFGEVLVPLSIIDISDQEIDVDDLLDAVSSAQFDLLYAVAFSLNRGVGSSPKSLRKSPPSLSGDATEN